MGVSTATTNPGTIGGSNSRTLTTTHLPSHRHDVSIGQKSCTFSLNTTNGGYHTHIIYSLNPARTKRLFWSSINSGLSTVIVGTGTGTNKAVLASASGTTYVELGEATSDKALLCDSGTAHSHSITGSIQTPAITNEPTTYVGSGAAFDNRPAYYELAYIIKL